MSLFKSNICAQIDRSRSSNYFWKNYYDDPNTSRYMIFIDKDTPVGNYIYLSAYKVLLNLKGEGKIASIKDAQLHFLIDGKTHSSGRLRPIENFVIVTIKKPLSDHVYGFAELKVGFYKYQDNYFIECEESEAEIGLEYDGTYNTADGLTSKEGNIPGLPKIERTERYTWLYLGCPEKLYWIPSARMVFKKDGSGINNPFYLDINYNVYQDQIPILVAQAGVWINVKKWGKHRLEMISFRSGSYGDDMDGWEFEIERPNLMNHDNYTWLNQPLSNWFLNFQFTNYKVKKIAYYGRYYISNSLELKPAKIVNIDNLTQGIKTTKLDQAPSSIKSNLDLLPNAPMTPGTSHSHEIYKGDLTDLLDKHYKLISRFDELNIYVRTVRNDFGNDIIQINKRIDGMFDELAEKSLSDKARNTLAEEIKKEFQAQLNNLMDEKFKSTSVSSLSHRIKTLEDKNTDLNNSLKRAENDILAMRKELDDFKKTTKSRQKAGNPDEKVFQQ